MGKELSQVIDNGIDHIGSFLDKHTVKDYVWVFVFMLGSYTVYTFLLSTKWALEDISKSQAEHLDWIKKNIPTMYWVNEVLKSTPFTALWGYLGEQFAGFGVGEAEKFASSIQAQILMGGSGGVLRGDLASTTEERVLIGGQGTTVYQKAFVIKQQIKQLENTRAQFITMINVLENMLSSPTRLEQLWLSSPSGKAMGFTIEEFSNDYHRQITELHSGIERVNGEIQALNNLLQALDVGALTIEDGRLVKAPEPKNWFDVGLIGASLIITYMLLNMNSSEMIGLLSKIGGFII